MNFISQVVITYVAYLCARLLDLREETRAARCIQVAWRRFRLKRRLELKKVGWCYVNFKRFIPYSWSSALFARAFLCVLFIIYFSYHVSVCFWFFQNVAKIVVFIQVWNTSLYNLSWLEYISFVLCSLFVITFRLSTSFTGDAQLR